MDDPRRRRAVGGRVRTELVRTLMAHELVDEFRIMIDPLVIGGGKRIFHDDGALRALRLVEHQVTTTGAMLATYARSEDVSPAES